MATSDSRWIGGMSHPGSARTLQSDSLCELRALCLLDAMLQLARSLRSERKGALFLQLPARVDASKTGSGGRRSALQGRIALVAAASRLNSGLHIPVLRELPSQGV